MATAQIIVRLPWNTYEVLQGYLADNPERTRNDFLNQLLINAFDLEGAETTIEEENQ